MPEKKVYKWAAIQQTYQIYNSTLLFCFISECFRQISICFGWTCLNSAKFVISCYQQTMAFLSLGPTFYFFLVSIIYVGCCDSFLETSLTSINKFSLLFWIIVITGILLGVFDLNIRILIIRFSIQISHLQNYNLNLLLLEQELCKTMMVQPCSR